LDAGATAAIGAGNGEGDGSWFVFHFCSAGGITRRVPAWWVFPADTSPFSFAWHPANVRLAKPGRRHPL